MASIRVAYTCPACDTPALQPEVCVACDAALPLEVYPLAPLERRLAGTLIDAILIPLTFGIGWFVWLAFVARRSQSPGKALMGISVIRSDGRPADPTYMWIREVVLKVIVVLGTAVVTAGAAYALHGAPMFFGGKRQTLHDRVADTLVVWGRVDGLADAD